MFAFSIDGTTLQAITSEGGPLREIESFALAYDAGCWTEGEVRMRIAIFVWIFAGACCIAGYAQQSPIDSRVTAALTGMGSVDVATRHAAFDNLVGVITEGQQLGSDPNYSGFLAAFFGRHPEQGDRIKLGLINLLKADNAAFTGGKTVPGTYTENDSEHYAQAISMVSSLNDERAIPALVGAMATGGIADAGLLKYGQKALGPVLNELGNPNRLLRSTAVSMAITILRKQDDIASRAQILSLIRTAIRDPDFLLRSNALYAIDSLSDEKQFLPALQEFVPALQEMAQHDSLVGPGGGHYPLRDRATKLLEKFANR